MEQKKEVSIRSSAAEYLTFVASTGDSEESVEMRYQDENIWLTQKMMAVLYDVDVRTINYHIKKIFEDNELEENSTIRKFWIVQTEGNRQIEREVNHIASEYTIKGWVMDDERLKQGAYLTDKYFEEQLERVRGIRASERKFYQKITDIYATAIDYDKNAASTKRFYATVQNKMHYAIYGNTSVKSNGYFIFGFC